MDDRLKSPSEAEHYLQTPTLGSVPDFETLGRRNGYRGYVSSRPPPDQLEASKNGTKNRELVVTQRTTPAGEAFRAVRTAIVFSRAGGAPRTILITSSILGEGKTVASINIAVAFAQLGNRTLLIDADLRRPRCHKALKMDNGPGLSEILVGQLEPRRAINVTGTPGFFVMTAGAPSPSPAELLASKQMQQLLVGLAQEFDHVLVDSAPVMPVSDAVALSTMVDGVLLVVSTQTPKQASNCRKLWIG